MPLKYCQSNYGSTSFPPAQISADGNQWIAGQPSYGANGEGRIIRGGMSNLNSIIFSIDGSYRSQVDVGFSYIPTANLLDFAYDTSNLGGANFGDEYYQGRVYKNGSSSLLVSTASGSASWIPRTAISGDGSTIAYRDTASSCVVKTWNGSSWVQKGGTISGSAIQINYDGNIVAIGSTVYSWDGSSWTQIQTILGFQKFASQTNTIVSCVNAAPYYVKVYDLVDSQFQQVGANIESSNFVTPSISPDGTKVAFGENKVYSMTGGGWVQIPIQGIIGSNIYDSLSVANSRLLARSNGPLHIFDLLTVPQVASGQAFSGKVGQTFTPVIPTIIDGPSIYWTASGLPPGLTINQSTGQITGTPTSKGAFSSTIIPSSESTTQSWRWGLPESVTFNIIDKDRLFFGPNLFTPNWAGSNASGIYYGSKKIWPSTV
jgi:hypothetical protein